MGRSIRLLSAVDLRVTTRIKTALISTIASVGLECYAFSGAAKDVATVGFSVTLTIGGYSALVAAVAVTAVALAARHHPDAVARWKHLTVHDMRVAVSQYM